MSSGRGTIWIAALAAALFVLPAMALQRRGADLRWAGAYAVAISALTYWAYARDKRRAQEGAWRLSEQSLHVLELLGGWPGALLAQRWLRHKSSKASFQMEFWLIVLLHQAVALDSFQNWRFSRAAIGW